MEMYEYSAAGERIAVVNVNEETGEETVDQAATARLNAPEAKRERAYVAEADPIRDRAMSYRMEADGWRLEGNEAKALEAEAKRDDALREYVAKKEEIRGRYPDELKG